MCVFVRVGMRNVFENILYLIGIVFCNEFDGLMRRKLGYWSFYCLSLKFECFWV